MTEPKLTVGRVETWRPIDYREEIYANWDLPENFVLRLTAAINSRMAELFPPAPQPEAKAEPDYSCPICRMNLLDCRHSISEIAAAANARIAELVRERDEARASANLWHDRTSEAAAECDRQRREKIQAMKTLEAAMDQAARKVPPDA